MEHLGFIVAAFALAGVAILGLVIAIVADYARLRRALDRLGAADRG